MKCQQKAVCSGVAWQMAALSTVFATARLQIPPSSLPPPLAVRSPVPRSLLSGSLLKNVLLESAEQNYNRQLVGGVLFVLYTTSNILYI